MLKIPSFRSVNHCICGNLVVNNRFTCSSCEGKNSLHLEGEIMKKQKKSNEIKSYWYVLMGQELYSYKTQGESKHLDMRSLSGVYIKDEIEELDDNGDTLHLFMLIFPNKRRIYYFKCKKDKMKWMDAIKASIRYCCMTDYYTLGDYLGKGKYGVVRMATHKRTHQKVAIKLIKKKELNLRDLELLKREIEVIKVLQHPSIIRFYDVFEDSECIQIVMELLLGGDLFTHLH